MLNRLTLDPDKTDLAERAAALRLWQMLKSGKVEVTSTENADVLYFWKDEYVVSHHFAGPDPEAALNALEG